jgi:hypothetical protein
MQSKQMILTDTCKIFATGVFLQPVKCNINGREQWRWVAVSFEDDSYYDGEFVDPVEYADNLEDMLNPTETEE